MMWKGEAQEVKGLYQYRVFSFPFVFSESVDLFLRVSFSSVFLNSCSQVHHKLKLHVYIW